MSWFKLDCVGCDVKKDANEALVRLEDVSSIGPVVQVVVDRVELVGRVGEVRLVVMKTGATYMVTPESAAKLIEALEVAP